jgi:hypothetical protein
MKMTRMVRLKRMIGAESFLPQTLAINLLGFLPIILKLLVNSKVASKKFYESLLDIEVKDMFLEFDVRLMETKTLFRLLRDSHRTTQAILGNLSLPMSSVSLTM